jgi:hypothetical protein
MLVLLRRQRGLRFMRDLSTLAYDLLDVVGRPYDGVDDVVMYVHETMIDPRKSDHPPSPSGWSRRHRAMWLRISTCIAGWRRSMSLR